ncbi:hypothetical protein GQ55_5G480200 [Panicum hallii var. hallii]|uniref:Uncharacterized protein n=1 Tax=Panicum hallii var. hallii TaxID=1504633 RepID=A0A2T7DR83_9POAL|nr:hypothetical protein GQ55_5G480200 [Panicum hallii var. hallii]
MAQYRQWQRGEIFPCRCTPLGNSSFKFGKHLHSETLLARNRITHAMRCCNLQLLPNGKKLFWSLGA